MTKIPEDKLGHLVGGFALFAWAGLAMPDMVALAVVVVVAAGKEAYDKTHPEKHKADVMDFLATVTGSVAAFVTKSVGIALAVSALNRLA